MKRFALLLLGVLLCVGIFWIARRPSEPADTSVPTQEPLLGGSRALPDVALPLEEPDASQPAPAGHRKIARVDAPDEAQPESFRFVVVEGVSGDPIPGAEIWWCASEEMMISDDLGSVHLFEMLEGAAPPPIDKLEALTRAAGTVMRSDATGQVDLPVSWPWIFARKGNLVGDSHSLWQDDGQPKLHLWPDGDFLVRCVDSTGRGVAGIGVLLIESHPWSPNGFVQQSAVTDAEGLALLPHGFVTVGSNRARNADSAWRVAAQITPSSAASQPLHPDTLPLDPITLMLPPRGSVEILIREIDGGPASIESPVGLMVAHDSTGNEGASVQKERPEYSRDAERRAATAKDGRVVFHDVALEASLIAFTARNRASRVHMIRFDGPVEAGASTTAELVLGKDAVVVRGRAVGPDGNPLCDQPLSVALFSGPSEERTAFENVAPEGIIQCDRSFVTTDPKGLFCIEYMLSAAHGGRPFLVLETRRKDSPRVGTLLDLQRNWVRGQHVLGDVRLDIEPLVAAGVVVDETGAAVVGARVGVIDGHDGPGIDSISDATGRFELRSCVPRHAIGIRADLEDFAPTWVVDGVPGRTDWLIELKHAGKFVAHFRLPIGAQPDDFCVAVEQSDHQVTESPANLSGNLGEDFAFDWDDCPPGTYTLVVNGSPESPEGLARVEGIQVKAGETTDVGTIDLTDPERIVSLKLEGPGGAPLGHCFYAFGPDGSKLLDELWSSRFTLETEEARLRLPRKGDRLDVALASFGMRTQVFSDVKDGQVLRLQAGIPITIAIANPVNRPPEGTHFLVGLIRDGLDRRATFLSSLDGYRAGFDERGEALLVAPEPGRYVLRWILERPTPRGGSARRWQDPSVFIDVKDVSEGQRFEVQCPIDPATAWDAK